jgi:hypothetical protein
MPEPRAQRTLVKSPPELWAEISDVAALARHLGEFGEIRIARLEPETTVVWEGDRARGTVELEPAGWGTKVTLTAEVVAEEPAAGEPPAATAAEAGIAGDEGPHTQVDLAAVQPRETDEPAVQERGRRRFLARFFARRRPETVAVETPVAVEPTTVTPKSTITETGLEAGPELPVAAPVAAAPLRDGELEAVLVGVLDDLGSARHRPYSRG